MTLLDVYVRDNVLSRKPLQPEYVFRDSSVPAPSEMLQQGFIEDQNDINVYRMRM